VKMIDVWWEENVSPHCARRPLPVVHLKRRGNPTQFIQTTDSYVFPSWLTRQFPQRVPRDMVNPPGQRRYYGWSFWRGRDWERVRLGWPRSSKINLAPSPWGSS